MKLPKIDNNSSRSWYKDRKYHRDNGLPAYEWVDGSKVWCKDGEYHRDNDLPAVERADGTKVWYKDGKEYFPAIRIKDDRS